MSQKTTKIALDGYLKCAETMLWQLEAFKKTKSIYAFQQSDHTQGLLLLLLFGHLCVFDINNWFFIVQRNVNFCKSKNVQ